MKPKLSVYVAGDVVARLAMAAKRPGTSKSKIINEALDRFLDPAREQHLAATIVQGGGISREKSGISTGISIS